MCCLKCTTYPRSLFSDDRAFPCAPVVALIAALRNLHATDFCQPTQQTPVAKFLRAVYVAAHIANHRSVGVSNGAQTHRII